MEEQITTENTTQSHSDDSEKWDFGLTPRIRTFVLYFCTDYEAFLNGTKAYKKAYRKRNKETGEFEELSDEVAAVNACKLLRKTKVKSAYRKLLAEVQDDLDEQNIYQVLNLYKMLASYNPADIITAEGYLKVNDLSELGPLALCISGIKRSTGKTDSFEVKLFDRNKALDMLAKYLNLVRPEITNNNTMPVIMLADKVSVSDFNQEIPELEETGPDPNEEE